MSLNSRVEISCYTNVEESNLPDYLAGGKIIGFIPSSRVLAPWECK